MPKPTTQERQSFADTQRGETDVNMYIAQLLEKILATLESKP